MRLDARPIVTAREFSTESLLIARLIRALLLSLNARSASVALARATRDGELRTARCSMSHLSALETRYATAITPGPDITSGESARNPAAKPTLLRSCPFVPGMEMTSVEIRSGFEASSFLVPASRHAFVDRRGREFGGRSGSSAGRRHDPARNRSDAKPTRTRSRQRRAAAAQADKDAAREQARVKVTSIHIVGAKRYGEAQLQALVQDLVGREVDFFELRRAADRIAQHYQKDGWFARAYLPEQSLSSGAVTIAVLEAHIGEVRIENSDQAFRVREEIIREMLMSRQLEPDALAMAALERAALLVDDLPGINAAVVLAPAPPPARRTLSRASRTRAWYRARWSWTTAACPPPVASVSPGTWPCNHRCGWAMSCTRRRTSAKATASADWPTSCRWAVMVGEWARMYLRSITSSAMSSGRWTPMARLSHWFRRRLSIDSQQPLRPALHQRHPSSAHENRALQIETSDSRVRAANAGLFGNRLDGFGGGGMWMFSAQVAAGNVDLSDNELDQLLDAATARTDGGLHQYSWNVGRLQRLGDRDRLSVNLTGTVRLRQSRFV